jgi:HAD superfamily hydrolase (TIGR01509 family)
VPGHESPPPTLSPKRPAPIKAVIFDIGRVIVRVNLNRLAETLAALVPSGAGAHASEKLSPQQVWSTIESDSRWADWQEGRMAPHQWYEHLTGRLRVAIGYADFCEAWNRALDPDPILKETLFERLGERYRLALLSNTDPLHSAHLEGHFAFMKHFPVRIYSWRIGASKPSPAIYVAALDALGISPAEALYIDDIAEYAAAAQQLGLDAIRFESSPQLLAQLSQRGLLDAPADHRARQIQGP